jgi:hypothetical protein
LIEGSSSLFRQLLAFLPASDSQDVARRHNQAAGQKREEKNLKACGKPQFAVMPAEVVV